MTTHTAKIAATLTAGTILSRIAVKAGLPAARAALPAVAAQLWLRHSTNLSLSMCEDVANSALEIVENELDLAALSQRE